jgi:hypothetical protein
MFANPDRAICGVAARFDVRSASDGRVLTAAMFERFIALQAGVPLRLSHGPLLTRKGAIRHIGKIRKFAAISHPIPGLLVLGEIDDIPEVEELLGDLRLMCSQTLLPPAWGFSIGAHIAAEEELAWPFEVSLTLDRADHDAKLLAVGAEAITTFALLTETRAAVNR